MKTSDFDFTLPEELIARYPLKNRAESRLLCLKSSEGNIEHRIFSQLPQLLNQNDILIFNNTRVIPARLIAQKKTGGKVEILIERLLENNCAYAQVKANKTLLLPCTVVVASQIEVTILAREDDLFILQFHTLQNLKELLFEIGQLPLPRYMQRSVQASDWQRYQTVYASQDGAVAAPTAGLHFDQSLLECLQQQGIRYDYITLHVGAGTFKPVRVAEIKHHQMHSEMFEISASVCDLINETRAKGGRIIAVGTTTVRALETALQEQQQLKPCNGKTNIFIYPGYRFKCIDALITNFHWPKSTLLMLVCALGGYQAVMASYQEAIKQRYRFYSYGDAMLITKSIAS